MSGVPRVSGGGFVVTKGIAGYHQNLLFGFVQEIRDEWLNGVVEISKAALRLNKNPLIHDSNHLYDEFL